MTNMSNTTPAPTVIDQHKITLESTLWENPEFTVTRAKVTGPDTIHMDRYDRPDIEGPRSQWTTLVTHGVTQVDTFERPNGGGVRLTLQSGEYIDIDWFTVAAPEGGR